MIQERLFELADEEYADFQVKLTPGISRESVIGVRIPKLRKLAKELASNPIVNDFLCELPHKYYDENILHSILLSQIKDYDESIRLTDMFLPYIDNWAVCDTLIPKIYSKHKDKLIVKIKEWISSTDIYTCRYGMGTLMRFYLDDDFKPEYLEMPAAVISKEYYVNMMIAWFFATALAKQWDATVGYIEQEKLGVWVNNKTIQKARESYRITDEQKEYLKQYKR